MDIPLEDKQQLIHEIVEEFELVELPTAHLKGGEKKAAQRRLRDRLIMERVNRIFGNRLV